MSEAVIKWALLNPFRAAIAWHSLSNVAYILKADPRTFLRRLLRFVVIPGTGSTAARQAIDSAVTDFEDALQVAAAEHFGATCIVTRNIRDYVDSPIPTMTPAEFIQRLTAGS
jgi:hypothetical protein